MRLVQLRLREIGEQAVVSAVAVDDNYLLASVARHLVGSFLQESELRLATVSHSAGLATGLGKLSEIIFGEDDDVFFLGRVQSGIADVQQIGAERKMRSVLL